MANGLRRIFIAETPTIGTQAFVDDSLALFNVLAQAVQAEVLRKEH